MEKIFLVFFLAIILGTANYAQEESFPYPEIEWATYFITTPSNFDSEGNFYFSGDKIRLEPPFPSPYDSLEAFVDNPEHPGHRFVGRLNNTQDIEFIKIFGPEAILQNNYFYDGMSGAIRWTDKSGNFYFAGLAEEEVGIGTPGAYQENFSNNWSEPYDVYLPDLDITITIDPEPCQDYFIMKFDKNGNNLWGSYYNGNQNIKGASIITNSDYIYLYGRTTSYEGITTPETYMPDWEDSTTHHYPRLFMQKLNAEDGIPVWGTYLDEPVDAPLNLLTNGTTVNSNGYIFYIVGNVLRILSPDGQLVGEQDLDLNASQFTYMYPDGSGNIYIIGNTENNDSIGTPNSFRPIKTYENQRFIIKYNQEGEKQWGSYLTPVESNVEFPIRFYGEKSDIYLATYTMEEGLATPGAFQETIAGGFDLAFMKIDGTDGSLKWLSYYGGEEDELYVEAIHLDEDQNLYLSIQRTFSPPEQLATQNALFPYPITYFHSLLVKFLNEKNIMSTKTPDPLSLKLFPNPAQGSLYLQSDEILGSQTEFVVYDLLGKKLKNFKGNQSQNQTFDISALSAGVYLLEINHSKKKQYLRFVKK